MARDIRLLRLAAIAAVGAVLVDIVLVLSEGAEKSFAVSGIPHHLAAIAVGGLLGWMYELLRELSAATATSLQKIVRLMEKIEYQDAALSMLLNCKRHAEVVSVLIAKSMKENFRNIPWVGEAEYLRLLSMAIEHSGGFQGIQRRPLSWFRGNGLSSYLENLRDAMKERGLRSP
jgi:hypothetical protein